MSDRPDVPKTKNADASLFQSIRHTAPDGQEYWSARELAQVLGYRAWEPFLLALDRARTSCETSRQAVAEHFQATVETVESGANPVQTIEIEDVRLSKFASYLLIQNADPALETVALAQAYFVVQINRAEQQDELAGLTEAQRRLYLRGEISSHNRLLASAARNAGVIRATDFAIFQDHGYMGLYAGERASDIHTRKGLKKGQPILDHMDSEELAANLFRATQTTAKLRREGVEDKSAANQTHFEVGREVRETIKRLGGTMPENLPTPAESIGQLEQKEKQRLKRGPQLSMFDDLLPEPEAELPAPSLRQDKKEDEA